MAGSNKITAWSLENFEIGKLIGKGGFGEVYLAREKKSKYIVALKSIATDKLKEHQLKHLLNEIRIHSSLKHPGVVRLHGWFFERSQVYLILEYCSEGTLYEHLSKAGAYSEKTTACFVSQIVSALMYCHSKEVIHRDLKPENILLGPHHSVKLADFGLSVFTPNTRRDTFCGTPGFLAPEIVAKSPYGKPADLWALGILTYELLGIKQDMSIEDVSKLPHISQQAKSFLQGVLKQNPEERMTIADVQRHAWIKSRSCVH